MSRSGMVRMLRPGTDRVKNRVIVRQRGGSRHPRGGSRHPRGGSRHPSGRAQAREPASAKDGRQPGSPRVHMTRRSLVMMEPFRSPFYAPAVVAVHGGHFAKAGFEVKLVTAEPGNM